MKTIAELTSDLRGQLCWGVAWEKQLGLSMSFGQPKLEVVREPNTSKSKSLLVRERSAYRHVRVTGEWWLWVFCALWTLRIGDSLTATMSSSSRKKTSAMDKLKGQKLREVRVNPLNGATEFEFDLGATLRARRMEKDDSDIWSLYRPNGYVLSVRGDGTFVHERGTTPVGKERPRDIGTPNQAL